MCEDKGDIRWQEEKSIPDCSRRESSGVCVDDAASQCASGEHTEHAHRNHTTHLLL